MQEDVHLGLNSSPMQRPAAEQVAAQHLPALFDRERLQCHMSGG